MKKVYNLRLNMDGTITVKVGLARESIGLVGKTKSDLFEAVKWALISKDAFVSDERLTTDLHEMIYRHL